MKGSGTSRLVPRQRGSAVPRADAHARLGHPVGRSPLYVCGDRSGLYERDARVGREEEGLWGMKRSPREE